MHLDADVVLHDAERAIDLHQVGLPLRGDVAQQLGDPQRELASAGASRSPRRARARGAMTSASDADADTRSGRRCRVALDACARGSRLFSCCSSAARSARHGASFAGSAACRAVEPDAAGVPGVRLPAVDQPVRTLRPLRRSCTSRLAMPAETPRNSSAAATCAQTGTSRHQCGLRIADCGLNCGFDRC